MYLKLIDEPVELGFIDADAPLEEGELEDLQHEAWVIVKDEFDALDGSSFLVVDEQTGNRYDLGLAFTSEWLQKATTWELRTHTYNAVRAFVKVPEHLK